MADGMPKPSERRSVVDLMRNRSRDIDAQVDAIVEPAKAPKQEQQKEAAQKGMPKPGMFDRLKKLITRD